MELRQVRYFLALSETLNFTRAAEQCNVAQPTLTLAIRKLEEELGGPLVHRERANTHLTSLGRMILPLLQQVTDSCNAAQQLAGEISRGDRIPLRLGVSCFVNPAHLLEPIRKMASEEMGLELSFCRDREPALLQQLLDGDLELMLGGIDTLDDAKLRIRQMYR
ncbi:MAG: LysR family transcriptional regulator [Pseudomonadota bacterium]